MHFKKQIYYIIIVLSIIIFDNQLSYGQNTVCFSDYLKNKQAALRPDYARKQAGVERLYRQAGLNAGFKAAVQYTLPVVFHIIHKDGTPYGQNEYLTIIQINDALNQINAALKGSPLCAGDDVGVDSEIELCLASKNVRKEKTDGIIYYEDDGLSDLDPCTEEEMLKGLGRVPVDSYPSTDYLNIWVVREICPSCFGSCELRGYATYPAEHGGLLDGVVIEAGVLTGDCNGMKTLIHEVGHYFNLLHTFEGGCANDDCLKDGDKVCDTPPDRDQNYYPDNPCVTNRPNNSCSTDVNPSDVNNPFTTDQEDADDNYMDYTPSSCATTFTMGQVVRMQAALEGPRASLLESKGCGLPCDDLISIALTYDDTTYAGQIYEVMNQSSSNITSHEWSVEGVILSSADLNYVFDTSGVYQVIYTAYNGDSLCIESVSWTVTVLCGLPTDFVVVPAEVEAGDTVRLMPGFLPPADVSLSWYVDGVLLTTGPSAEFIAQSEGSYYIELEVCDDNCCSRSGYYIFRAGNCPLPEPGRVWYFADHIEMDFHSDPPTFSRGTCFEAGINPQLDFGDEGTVLGYDEDGEILLYSNGRHVWNKNQQLMPNGDDVFDWTQISNTQNLLLRHPGQPHLFYLFISGDGTRFKPNLEYVLVDMNLDGGLGDVTGQRGTMLYNSTEKVTAVRHCNGRDYWILGHENGSRRFAIALFDEAGLHPAQFQNVGLGNFMTNGTTGSVTGVLKANSQGDRLVMCTTPHSNDDSTHVQLFRFDPSSGLISDPVLVRWGGPWGIQNYGAAFSPDGNRLYITGSFEGFSHSYFEQYDLSVYDRDSILASRDSILWNMGRTELRNFQLGPKGKMYVYRGDTIGVIHRPNLPVPLCDFEYDIGPVQGFSVANLPHFPNDHYVQYTGEIEYNDRPLYEAKAVCLGDSIYLDFEDVCTNRDYEWNVPDEALVLEEGNRHISLRFDHVGRHEVILYQYKACTSLSDTAVFVVAGCDADCVPDFAWRRLDTLVCAGEDVGLEFNTNAVSIRSGWWCSTRSLYHAGSYTGRYLPKSVAGL